MARIVKYRNFDRLGMWLTKNAYKILMGIYIRKVHLKEREVDGMLILRWMLRRYNRELGRWMDIGQDDIQRWASILQR
jgi:hypothetical protein